MPGLSRTTSGKISTPLMLMPPVGSALPMWVASLSPVNCLLWSTSSVKAGVWKKSAGRCFTSVLSITSCANVLFSSSGRGGPLGRGAPVLFSRTWGRDNVLADTNLACAFGGPCDRCARCSDKRGHCRRSGARMSTSGRPPPSIWSEKLSKLRRKSSETGGADLQARRNMPRCAQILDSII